MSPIQGGAGLAPATVCGCNWRRIIHFIDAGMLLTIQVLQGSILNFYIIEQYSNAVLPYFWFVGDFLCLFVFAGTLTIAYKYFNRLTDNDGLSDGSSFKLSPARLISGYSTSKFGVLPLSYVSWLFYSAILIGKVAIIYKSELRITLSPTEFFGPQLLQATIGFSAVILLLLAESHNWAKHRSARYHFVTSTCAHSGLAVLDTVSLLNALLPQDAHRTSEPPDVLLDVVLFFGLINLALPALALYRLGLSEPSAEKAQARLLLPFSVLHDLVHLILVDVPFLGLRLYLWRAHNQHASVFMIKNVLGILLAIRSIHPDISELIARRHRLHVEEQHNPQHNSLLLEMSDVRGNRNQKTAPSDLMNGIEVEDLRSRDIGLKNQ
jgi:hypothetical protein